MSNTLTDTITRARELDWLEMIGCSDRDPELYSLESKLYRDTNRQRRARWLCRGCPVMRECAADALEPLAYSTVRAGVWIPSPSSSSGLTRAGWKIIREGLAEIASGATDADALALDAVPGRPGYDPEDASGVWSRPGTPLGPGGRPRGAGGPRG